MGWSLVLAPNSPRDAHPGLPDEWFPNQKDLLQKVLDWYEGDKRFLLISAPTGTGKSLLSIGAQAVIGARVHAVVSTLRLSDQMRTSYKHAPVLKGRDNYECLIIPQLPVSQAPCQVGFDCSLKVQCPYFIDKESSFTSPYAVFNYQLYMNLKEYSDTFPTADILFCDEAHLAEGEIEKYMSATISDQDIASRGWRRPRGLSVLGMAGWAEPYLEEVAKESTRTKKQLFAMTGGSGGSEIKSSSRAYTRVMAKYTRLRYLQRQLGVFVSAGQDEEEGRSWVFDRIGHTYQVRPTFADEYNWALFGEKPRVVLMSATIKKEDAARLGIDDFDFVEVGSSYEVNHRPIIYRPVASVARRMDEGQLTDLIDEVDNIIDYHSKQGHKGIIHSVSYERAKNIYERSANQPLLLLHDSENKSTIIRKFKDSDEPLVLISPSVIEGEDFPNAECRYIIIPKVPYGNLGDRVVKEKMEENPEWYSWNALVSLIQGAGRGVRNQDDWCITYVLDSNFGKIWKKHDEEIPQWFRDAIQGKE